MMSEKLKVPNKDRLKYEKMSLFTLQYAAISMSTIAFFLM